MFEYIGVDGMFIFKNKLSGKDSLRYDSNFQPEKTETLLLPFPGEYAIQSNFHQRWKIFDHNRGTVTTVYGDTYDDDRILQEIKSSFSASYFEMAPRIFDYSVQEKWIIEELINGKELWPANWGEVRFYYEEYINGLIAEIIKRSPIIKTRVMDYILPKAESIKEFLYASSRLGIECSNVLRFLSDVVSQLENNFTNQEILLVCTHGDFKFSHVVVTEKGPFVIDWETIGTRSALFDFLNPICPWLIHHDVNELDAQEFPLVIDSFLQSIERISYESFGRVLKGAWDLHVEAFWIDRLARILQVGHSSKEQVVRSMARSVEGFSRFNMVLRPRAKN